MVSQKIDCPLCKKEVTQNGFGVHLLSDQHVKKVKELNPTVMNQYSEWINVHKFKTLPRSAGITVFKMNAHDQFSVCLVCKKAYKGAGTRPDDEDLHFTKYPRCKEKYLDAIAAFCTEKKAVIDGKCALADAAATKKIEEQAACMCVQVDML